MKIDRDAPVGVFDSGIGGLTVARDRIFPSDNPFPERAEGEGDCGGL